MHVPPNWHPRSEQNLTSSGNLFMFVILIKMCLDVSWGVEVRLKDNILDHGTKQDGVFWGLERRKWGLWEQALEEDVGLPALVSPFASCPHEVSMPAYIPPWYPASQPCIYHSLMVPQFPNPAYIILLYYSALPCTLLNTGIKGVCHHAQSGRWVFIFLCVGFHFSLILFLRQGLNVVLDSLKASVKTENAEIFHICIYEILI